MLPKTWYLFNRRKNDHRRAAINVGTMFKITDGTIHFMLDYSQCTDLELKINVSSKSKEMGHISAYLYDYAMELPTAVASIKVEHHEYTFLCRLMEKKSWEDCQGL
jgi:hypothetical protein